MFIISATIFDFPRYNRLVTEPALNYVENMLYLSHIKQFQVAVPDAWSPARKPTGDRTEDTAEAAAGCTSTASVRVLVYLGEYIEEGKSLEGPLGGEWSASVVLCFFDMVVGITWVLRQEPISEGSRLAHRKWCFKATLARDD